MGLMDSPLQPTPSCVWRTGSTNNADWLIQDVTFQEIARVYTPVGEILARDLKHLTPPPPPNPHHPTPQVPSSRLLPSHERPSLRALDGSRRCRDVRSLWLASSKWAPLFLPTEQQQQQQPPADRRHDHLTDPPRATDASPSRPGHTLACLAMTRLPGSKKAGAAAKVTLYNMHPASRRRCWPTSESRSRAFATLLHRGARRRHVRDPADPRHRPAPAEAGRGRPPPPADRQVDMRDQVSRGILRGGFFFGTRLSAQHHIWRMRHTISVHSVKRWIIIFYPHCVAAVDVHWLLQRSGIKSMLKARL